MKIPINREDFETFLNLGDDTFCRVWFPTTIFNQELPDFIRAGRRAILEKRTDEDMKRLYVRRMEYQAYNANNCTKAVQCQANENIGSGSV